MGERVSLGAVEYRMTTPSGSGASSNQSGKVAYSRTVRGVPELTSDYVPEE